MTRISSLLVASTLAILPLSAFAQQTGTAAKTAEPTGMTATAPAATTTPAAKTPAAKTPAAKTETHAMTPHAKSNTPVKADPSKS